MIPTNVVDVCINIRKQKNRKSNVLSSQNFKIHLIILTDFV